MACASLACPTCGLGDAFTARDVYTAAEFFGLYTEDELEEARAEHAYEPISTSHDEMNYVGKHRGWLLVYELQYWIILALSLFAIILASGSFESGIAPALVILVFWGALIGSLYGSTDIVRRVHIAFNWVGATATLAGAFNEPPDSANPAARLGEHAGKRLRDRLLRCLGALLAQIGEGPELVPGAGTEE